MAEKLVTLPDPRCPMCNERLEVMQLTLMENPLNPTKIVWHEVWSCDSCKTNHIFPARLAFLESLGIDPAKPVLEGFKVSQQMEKHHRVIHLPRGVKV